MKAVTREDLDGLQCSNPDCTENHGEFYLQPVCHPDAALSVNYEDGVMRINCKRCGKQVLAVQVASAPRLMHARRPG